MRKHELLAFIVLQHHSGLPEFFLKNQDIITKGSPSKQVTLDHGDTQNRWENN